MKQSNLSLLVACALSTVFATNANAQSAMAVDTTALKPAAVTGGRYSYNRLLNLMT